MKETYTKNEVVDIVTYSMISAWGFLWAFVGMAALYALA